jgi:uncharacterized repeat protein (TIGR01451 family)
MKPLSLDRITAIVRMVALLTLMIVSTVQAEYTSKLIMLGGQDAPGVPGAKFSSSLQPTGIALSDNGRALFSAYLEQGVGGITFDNDEGIWMYESGTLRLLVQKGGAVPRFTQVKLLNDGLPLVFMGPDGQIGMEAFYSPDGTLDAAVQGFFLEENGQMFQKFTIPLTLPTGDTLFAGESQAYNAGRFLLTGGVRGPNTILTQESVIVEYGPEGFSVISQKNHPLPGVEGGWLFSVTTMQNLITAAGKTIFSVKSGRMADNGSLGVVYSWDPVNGHIPLRVSEIDTLFGIFGDYHLNTQGNTANITFQQVGVSYTLFNDGDLPIVSEGEVAEGSGGDVFNNFVNFGLFDNDSVIFQAATSDGRVGIWGGDVTGLKKIAIVGDPAPGRPGDHVFWRVNNMDINRNGLVAFSDLAVDPLTGSEYVGVWIGRTSGGLQVVTQTGDVVESQAGPLTLTGAFVVNQFMPRTGADGLLSGLNDKGEILLSADFEGGLFGLIIAIPGGMVVNSNGDDPDIDPGDGICDTGNELPNGDTECTLRAAIMQANAIGRFVDIDFDIEGNTVITPQSALPVVEGGKVIDGTSQPDARPIVLDGVNAGADVDGLELTGIGSTIAGLEIGRFSGSGIKIAGASGESAGHIIIDCYIGLRSELPMEFGNLRDGILVETGSENQIGSPTTVMPRSNNFSVNRVFDGWNYISGNKRDGIRLAMNSSDNDIWHNIIGLREDGSILANSESGIAVLDSDQNTIGGVDYKERNIVSGNAKAGITISGTSTSLAPSSDYSSAENRVGLSYVQAEYAKGYSPSVIGSNANLIINNFIGLTKEGAVAGNGFVGVEIFTDSNLVGGANDSGNVISGNAVGGISIRRGEANRISGNFIGVDTFGLSEIGNGGPGVLVSSSSNTHIGGRTSPGGELLEGNLISGNDGAGVDVFGSELLGLSDGTRIWGNYIGVGADNNTAIPNFVGVRVEGAPSSSIGSGVLPNSALGNQIRENETSGLLLFTDDCVVEANRIERNGYVAPAGGGPAGGNGIMIVGARNFINIPFFARTQIIARNNGVGILVLDAQDHPVNGNSLDFNSIFANVKGGIDLAPVGPNANDNLDADGGANDGQNSPQLLSVEVSPTKEARIIGILRSKPDEDFLIVAYANDACDANGLGQGQLWIGNTGVTTNSSGDAQIDFTTLALAAAPQNVTLTATNRNGSTSEFSNCGGSAGKRVDLVVTKSDDNDSASVDAQIRYEITVRNQGQDTASSVTMVDSLPSPITYVTDTTDSGVCDFLNRVLTCDLGKLSPGDSAIIVLIASVNSVGLIENAATAFAVETDENPTDNIGIDSTIGSDIQTDVDDSDFSVLPRDFSLSQNHPNPFNPITVISYALPEKSDVTISIYNILGQNVRTFVIGEQSAGRYSVSWNASNDRGEPVSSGMYFYKLTAGDFSASRKMVLLK